MLPGSIINIALVHEAGSNFLHERITQVCIVLHSALTGQIRFVWVHILRRHHIFLDFSSQVVLYIRTNLERS